MQHKSLVRIVSVLVPCVLFHALGMDIFVSCIPNITESFATSTALVQWILSIFLISTGAGQLFIGPYVDKFGRRPVMLASALTFAFFSIICSLSTNIYMLIVARFFQGLGACGSNVCGFAIIRDVFDDDDRPKAYSYINAAIALAPMLAPIIGTFLFDLTLTWRSSFYFLTAFGILGYIVTYIELDETKPKDTKPIEFGLLVRYNIDILLNKNFMSLVFCAITALTALFLFFSLAPTLIITHLGYSKHIFSLCFAFNAVAYLIGSIVCPMVYKRLGGINTIMVGSSITCLFGLAIVFIHNIYGLSLLGLILPNFMITFSTGLIFGPASSGALSPFKTIAGTAAAMYGFLEYGGPGIIGVFVLKFVSDNALPLGYTMMVMGMLNLILMANLKRTEKNG